MDEVSIFNYARRYADRAEQSGRGTQFPTVRQSARRFRCRQQMVVELVEQSDASAIPGADYFDLAVGIGIGIGGGGGYCEFESIGDYLIEAYRHDPH